MDAEFLKRTVGDPLSQALASLIISQPVDHIEFIGEYLLDYVKRREDEARCVKRISQVNHMLKIANDKKAQQVKVEEAAKEEANAKARAEGSVENSLGGALSHTEIYSKVLELLRDKLGATGGQIGRRMVMEGQELIQFIAASDDRQDMVGNELKGPEAGDDAEDGLGEEGVTFDVWKKTEVRPPRDPVLDEDGEPAPENEEPELIPPEHVIIENVMREPRVKFFGMPKLGAYLAVPMTYSSWLHPGGITFSPSDSASAGEDQDEESEVALNEDAADGAKASGGRSAKGSTYPYRKSTSTVQLVLCLDTLGQGRCFTSEDIQSTKQWAEKVVSALESLEDRLFKSEASLLPALTGAEAADLLAKVNTSEARDVVVSEALVAAGDIPEDEKQRVVKRAQYRHKVRVVEAMKDFVGLMGKLNLAPSGTALSVLEQALVLVGKPRSDLCDRRGQVDWAGKMRMVISTELIPAIAAFNPEDPGSAQRATEVKGLVEAVDAEELKATNIPAWAILKWILAAVAAAEEAAELVAAALAAAAEGEGQGGEEE